MRPVKATFEQIRRHNRRLVLGALYTQSAESRAELASVTGLTKPTVSNLIAELLEEGLVSEQGPGRSGESGGKRPTLLRFEPDARQVIGLAVSGSRVLGVLANLAGRSAALHLRQLEPGETALDDGAAPLRDAVAGLLPQLDAPLLCVGVGLPGAAEREVAAGLRTAFAVPVHLANRAELSALGQMAFANNGSEPGGTLVTLMVDDTVEIGVCLAGGRLHYGSDLSELRLDGRRLAEGLAWPQLAPQVASLAERHAPLVPGGGSLGYLSLRAAEQLGDPAAAALTAELAARAAPLLAWVVATLRPAEVSLGGGLADLGEPFLTQLRQACEALLPAEQLRGLRLSLAYAEQLSAMGAVALAVQEELELWST